jgi:hypothetical protein
VITISSNAISLRSIIITRNSINAASSVSRRRVEETRRVVVIITIECLLAIISSWLVDIILSIKHCGRSVVIGDDCPYFLRRSQIFLAFSDLINSMSNILLYCYAGRRFRHEFELMIQACLNAAREHLLCCCRLEWQRFSQSRRSETERCMIQSSLSTKPTKMPLGQFKLKQEYIALKLRQEPTNIS